MDFEVAVKYLKQGERVSRSKWKKAYLFIDNDKLKMTLGKDNSWHYAFRNEDLLSNDWKLRD